MTEVTLSSQEKGEKNHDGFQWFLIAHYIKPSLNYKYQAMTSPFDKATKLWMGNILIN